MESRGHLKGLGLPQTSNSVLGESLPPMELGICGPFALHLSFFLGVSIPLRPGTDSQVGWTDGKSVSLTVDVRMEGFH